MVRRRAGRVLGQQPARGGDLGVERRMTIGIDDVDAAAEHRERRAPCAQSAAVRRGVDPERAARDDRQALSRGHRGQLAREATAREARSSRPDDGEAAVAPPRKPPRVPELLDRLGHCPKLGRKAGVI